MTWRILFGGILAHGVPLACLMGLHPSLSKPAAWMLIAAMPALQFVCRMRCPQTECMRAGHARRCLAQGSSCACTPASASFRAELPTRRAGAWSPAAHAPGEPLLDPCMKPFSLLEVCVTPGISVRDASVSAWQGTHSQRCAHVHQRPGQEHDNEGREQARAQHRTICMLYGARHCCVR